MFLHMCVCPQEGCLLQGGVPALGGGVPGPGGTWSQGGQCLVPWGVCSGGVPGPGERVCSRGVPGPRGAARGGVWFWGSAPGGIPACTEADSPPRRRDGYCCRWYASYWNAFLFTFFVYAKKIASVGVSLESFLNECHCWIQWIMTKFEKYYSYY